MGCWKRPSSTTSLGHMWAAGSGCKTWISPWHSDKHVLVTEEPFSPAPAPHVAKGFLSNSARAHVAMCSWEMPFFPLFLMRPSIQQVKQLLLHPHRTHLGLWEPPSLSRPCIHILCSQILDSRTCPCSFLTTLSLTPPMPKAPCIAGQENGACFTETWTGPSRHTNSLTPTTHSPPPPLQQPTQTSSSLSHRELLPPCKYLSF